MLNPFGTGTDRSVYSMAAADYDGDGRVNILIANHGAAPTAYRNVFESGHHWLAIDLAGQHANPNAVGARVTVRTASGDQVQEVRLGTAYLSQSPATLHFGMERTSQLIRDFHAFRSRSFRIIRSNIHPCFGANAPHFPRSPQPSVRRALRSYRPAVPRGQ